MGYQSTKSFVFDISAGMIPFLTTLMDLHVYRQKHLYQQLEASLFIMNHTNSWDHVDINQFFWLISEIREAEILLRWMGDLISELHSNLHPDRWIASTRDIIWRTRETEYCGEMTGGILPPTHFY